LHHKYDIPAIRQVEPHKSDFEEIGALSPQQQQDIPRVMEIAKKFGLEILPPPGASRAESPFNLQHIKWQIGVRNRAFGQTIAATRSSPRQNFNPADLGIFYFGRKHDV
jgi:hypothetical protein